jgi:hypothetical protein
MDREELGKMKLEALRLLALEQGVDEARGMGKAELIDRLLPDKRAPESIVEPAPQRHQTPSAIKPERDGGFGVPSSTVHPHVEAAAPAGEPIGMLDFEELPESYGVDECEVLYKDPHWVFAYWEVTDGGLSSARAQLGQSASSSTRGMRLFTTLPGSDGVERQIDDVELPWNNGRRYLHAPRSGAHLRIAVGLLSHEGYFAPIAHSSLVRVPPSEPQPGPVEWMEVVPPRTRGREREPLVIVRRGGDRAERGVLAPEGFEKGGSSPTAGPPGSSPTKRDS